MALGSRVCSFSPPAVLYLQVLVIYAVVHRLKLILMPLDEIFTNSRLTVKSSKVSITSQSAASPFTYEGICISYFFEFFNDNRSVLTALTTSI